MNPTALTSRRREGLGCITWALLITLIHLGILVQIAMPAGGFHGNYQRLVQHDSYWFLNIIGRGYQSPVPPSPVKRMEVSNVAFFPLFPLWGATVTKTLGLEPKTGLTVASQLATWGFWSYFLLVARRRLAFSRGQCVAAVALVIAHPAAFFLIAAYSESLFLMMLLGFMFWSVVEGRRAFFLAALHGVLMTGTRIAGAPTAAFPVVREWFARWPARTRVTTDRVSSTSPRPATVLGISAFPSLGTVLPPLALQRALALMAISLVGMTAFFVYCHVRFQHWNFYMMTQEAGWGVRADYLALFKLGAYRQWTPNWDVASQVGQFFVPVTMLGFTTIAVWEFVVARTRATRWRERIGFYFVGAALFYISVCGVYSVRLESMTRYHFCTHVFLILGALHAFADIGPTRTPTRRLLIALAVVFAIFGARLQHTFASQFVHGGWVA